MKNHIPMTISLRKFLILPLLLFTASIVRGAGNLPVIYINVYTDDTHSSLNDEIIDKDLSHKDYFKYAEYWLDLNGYQWPLDGAKNIGSQQEPLPLQIKARGNYTRWGFSKKPFKLKLEKKQDLLGLTPEKSKHYALLAHADDSYGFMRNFTMFNLGQRIELPWTPSQLPVELYINNKYRGLYFLTESIRVGDGRIDIAELDDKCDDPELASGGYIVELDNYEEENQIQLEENSCVEGHNLDRLRITFDTPEVYSELQRRFIADQFYAINEAIGKNSNDTWSYLDLDDAARYYIVKEIISDTESYHGSTYLYRDRGGNQKWHFSPLWDAGNGFNGPTNDYFYNHDPFGNTWIPSLRTNSKFNEKVRTTWLWFMSNCYDGLYDDLEEYCSTIKEAAVRDWNYWKSQPKPNGQNFDIANNSNIDDQYNRVVNHLKNKISWLSTQNSFGNYSGTPHTEPERDNTDAAPLPSYLKDSSINNDNEKEEDENKDSSSLNEIINDKDDSVEYYNMQGIRIMNPVKGHIYIVKKGDASYKIVY